MRSRCSDICISVWSILCFPREAFLSELAQVVGHEITPPEKWNFGAPEGGSASSGPKPIETALPETVAELQSMKHQTQKLGFIPDAFVTSKQAKEAQVWQIQSVDDDKVELRLMVDGHKTESQSVGLDNFVQDWRLHKGKVSCLLPQWDATANPCCPLASSTWATDAIKGAIAIGLRLQFETHKECIKSLELLQNPAGVKVLHPIPKGSLVLVAASQRIDKAKSTTSVPANAFVVGSFAMPEGSAVFTVSPHFVPPVSGTGEANKGGWVAPFWLVESAGASATANMELRFEAVEVGPFRVNVPVLVNTNALAKGARLVWKKALKDQPQTEQSKRRKIVKSS